MNTAFLQSFVTVVEHGSIAEAARRLNLTAAAVAQRIHALESEIGTRLFISLNTVKFHVRSIFLRLGVRNRMAAARLLARHRG